MTSIEFYATGKLYKVLKHKIRVGTWNCCSLLLAVTALTHSQRRKLSGGILHVHCIKLICGGEAFRFAEKISKRSVSDICKVLIQFENIYGVKKTFKSGYSRQGKRFKHADSFADLKADDLRPKSTYCSTRNPSCSENDHF